MPIQNPTYQERLNREQNVVDTTVQLRAAPRIPVGSLAHTEELASKRPAEFLPPTATDIEAAIERAKARIAALHAREAAVKALKQRNAELFEVDLQFENALSRCGWPSRKPA